jgi:uncharacterized protein (DUF1015 family)
VQTHFPSGGSGLGAGLVLAPFRGVRYDLSRVGGLANVTSPPYDVIGPGTLEGLRAASPYNVVRLILPEYASGSTEAAAGNAGVTGAGLSDRAGAAVTSAAGTRATDGTGAAVTGPAEARTADSAGAAGAAADSAGARATGQETRASDAASAGAGTIDDGRLAEARTAGRVAATLLRDWLAAGALAVDAAPALYVYEQRGADWVQRGLIGLVAVGTDAVHPHENVMPGPVAGRRELMKATRSNLEPILLVYSGGAGAGHQAPASPDGARALTASELTDRAADSGAPLARAVTDDGVTHQLWAVTDPAAQQAIAADLATRTALIADGHHRYAAYRELQSQMREAGAGDGPWDYGLAFLVDAEAYPLHLGPIHRVLPRLGLAEAAGLAAGAFRVTEVHGDLDAALRALEKASESGHAFLLAGQAGFRLLTDPDQRQLDAAMPAAASPRWRALDASVMRELLFARLWSIKDNERDVQISHNPAEAVRMAVSSHGTAVLCSPMPIAAVMELAAHGEKVPRKSTSFGPKPRTGLVLRTFEP